MLDFLKIKREECLDEIAVCEKELEKAKNRLEFLDEVISDAEEEFKEATDTATDVNNGSVAMFN